MSKTKQACIPLDKDEVKEEVKEEEEEEEEEEEVDEKEKEKFKTLRIEWETDK